MLIGRLERISKRVTNVQMEQKVMVKRQGKGQQQNAFILGTRIVRYSICFCII